MKSKNTLQQKNIYCPECGSLITVDAILINNSISLKYIFCPECGKKINFKSYSIKTFDVAQIDDKNNNGERLNSALELIIYDKEFPQEFKDTYFLLIARMIYIKLRKYEKEVNTPILQMELTPKLIETIEAQLISMITKKPILSVLKYLDKANYSGFFSDLKMHQRKIRKIKKYRKAFFLYLRWIIEIVFKIINQIDTDEGLINLEKAIRDDLIEFFGLETREKKERSPVEQSFFSKIKTNELILVFDINTNSYNLLKIREIESYKNLYIFGLDENFQLKELPIQGIEKKHRDFSININFKHGILSLSKQHNLLSVDENLNVIQIAVKDVKEETPILMPRIIDIIEDNSALDFSNCGEILEENGIQYVKYAQTKAFRYVEKNFEVGYILGHYCSEGSMKYITISCGNNKAEMKKLIALVEKNFGYTFYIGKYFKQNHKTVYSVNSNTILIKLIFTKGLRLTYKKAPFKEIPPFLYNAPIECVKGFLAAFLEGDGRIDDIIRKNSSGRDVDVRLYTSSRKLVFGLSFLLKRLGIVNSVFKTEFDNNQHPTWYDAYTLRIKGKMNMNILREFIPKIPEIGHFGRDKEPVIDLNMWMKKLNLELIEKYGISLRMLSEKGKIPYIAARCAQKNSTMNISEAKMLKTLNFLIRRDLITPTLCKLLNLFARNTVTKVKSIEVSNDIGVSCDLLVPFCGVYIAGIGQIYVKN